MSNGWRKTHQHPLPINHTHFVAVVPALPAAHIYTYSAPSPLAIGTWVQISFGKRMARGVVVGVGHIGNIPAHKIKQAIALPQPPLSAGMVQFMLRAAEYTCSNAGDVLQMIDKEGSPLKRIVTWPAPQLHAFTPTLNTEQQQAVEAITCRIAQYAPFLLDGVTGAGKTAVYLEACAVAMQQHRQVIILLPEIALTLQMAERFEKRFGIKPPCWSSHTSPAQKRAIWHGFVNGHIPVVIGARSALFLPMHHTGLIIVDEEHDSTYKQEDGVRYHARDMAVLRAHCEGMPVILGSATPSLETHVNADQQRYQRLVLTHRYGGAQMPHMHVVDMRGQRGILSEALQHALNTTQHNGQMSLLYVNRRGYAPLMICRRCGHREMCSSCDIQMNLHQMAQKLQCHACGSTRVVSQRCPTCGGHDTFAPCGYGVERVAEEVSKLYPSWRVRVMSSDCRESPSALQELLHDINQKQVDVLVGTQIVAKGHDFAHLTCVGVVDADLGLSGGDLRASEQTFQLIEQVAGRAGRAQYAGQVYIQTHDPEHAVIQALQHRDRAGFLAAETAMRRAAGYPPFGGLAAVIASCPNEQKLQQWMLTATQTLPKSDDIHFYGPTPALFYKIRERYRVRWLFKTPRRAAFAAYFTQWKQTLKIPHDVRMVIDIDPYSFT